MRVVRTLVSLPAEDKDWLDREARARRLPMTELVRTAVRRMRDQEERAEVGLEELLRRTAGIWRRGDPLAWQRGLRREWPPRR